MTETTEKTLPSIHQILKEVDSKVSKEEKLNVLRENDSRTLRYILQGAYDKNVQSLLPDGEPPYNTVDKKDQNDLYYYETDLPKLFKNGPMQSQPMTKVEMFFIGMLSKLSSEEAKILVLMKDQRLNSVYKKITKPVVKEFLADTVTIK